MISTTFEWILVPGCEARYLSIQTFSFLQTLGFEIASIYGITTPLVVEIKDRARLVFKKHPFKLVKDDLTGEFSSMPYDVLHNEDIRA